jgi:hypothetical protein
MVVLLLDSVVNLIFVGEYHELQGMSSASEFFFVNPERKRPYRDLGVCRRVILRLILKKCDLYSTGSGQVSVADFC